MRPAQLFMQNNLLDLAVSKSSNIRDKGRLLREPLERLIKLQTLPYFSSP